jgi:hypothetical protein
VEERKSMARERGGILKWDRMRGESNLEEELWRKEIDRQIDRQTGRKAFIHT